MNYPDASVEVSKNTLTPYPPLSHAKEGEISVHPGLGFPSLPGREGLGVSQGLMGVDYVLPRCKHRGILSIKIRLRLSDTADISHSRWLRLR